MNAKDKIPLRTPPILDEAERCFRLQDPATCKAELTKNLPDTSENHAKYKQ